MIIDIKFILNEQPVTLQTNPNTILLDYLRKDQKLTGTKEVCKEGDCGACAVLLGTLNGEKVEYKAINSCLYPIQKIRGKHIVTIEGLTSDSVSEIQQSFIDEGASQCGFCTPGFIISLTAYLINCKNFILDDAINSVAGNICRCTGYHSIIRSIKQVGQNLAEINNEVLIKNRIIPEYFNNIPEQLKEINNAEKISNDYSKIISGGTDLFVQKPEEMLELNTRTSESLIFPQIWKEDNIIYISGSATVTDLEKFFTSEFKQTFLSDLFRLFASLPIKNSATIAGNLVNASPIADLTISLLALDASIKLENKLGQERSIKLLDFFIDYKKVDKSTDEIIKTIYFDLPDSNAYFNFEKVSKRRHLDIASVNSAISLKIIDGKIQNVNISAGGVAPIPLFLKKSSDFMTGKKLTNTLLLETLDIIKSEINPISDIRGSAEYKTLLLSQLFKAHFLKLFPSIVNHEVLTC